MCKNENVKRETKTEGLGYMKKNVCKWNNGYELANEMNPERTLIAIFKPEKLFRRNIALLGYHILGDTNAKLNSM